MTEESSPMMMTRCHTRNTRCMCVLLSLKNGWPPKRSFFLWGGVQCDTTEEVIYLKEFFVCMWYECGFNGMNVDSTVCMWYVIKFQDRQYLEPPWYLEFPRRTEAFSCQSLWVNILIQYSSTEVFTVSSVEMCGRRSSGWRNHNNTRVWVGHPEAGGHRSRCLESDIVKPPLINT